MDTPNVSGAGLDPVDEALGLMRRIADVVEGDGAPLDGQPQPENG